VTAQICTSARHERFRFRTSAALGARAAALGIDLPFDEPTSALLDPAPVGALTAPNRITVQPMEGCDAAADGAPSDLTRRRYRRYAEGGNGMIWFEATSVMHEGRSNPRQPLLTRETQPAFRALVELTRQSARRRFGERHQVVLVLQLTHSGRYSNPDSAPAGRIACANPLLDRPGTDRTLWRDEELARIGERFVEAGVLALDAGFDAVDVKACHGYLLSELLAAHTRRDSHYGGELENRSRLLLDVVRGLRQARPRGLLAVRLNATDALPHPYGFGVRPDESGRVDLAEPLALARALVQSGCGLLNITAGIPAHTAHVGRPFERAAGGGPAPPEHPLAGVARLIGLAAAVQRELAHVPVVASGLSWLRQFWPNVGAAVIRRRMATFVGVGRAAFAYPDAARDLMEGRALDPHKCCIACSRCTELMRARRPTGCVMRDGEVYSSAPALVRRNVRRRQL
jgi:2,4-dienoyl-CoA reductase-like NADH-dependent reductase (Old Yellow Enzyme family)